MRYVTILQIYLEEVEPYAVTVTPTVSQEHADNNKQKKNSTIIVEEVGNFTISSIELLRISRREDCTEPYT